MDIAINFNEDGEAFAGVCTLTDVRPTHNTPGYAGTRASALLNGVVYKTGRFFGVTNYSCEGFVYTSVDRLQAMTHAQLIREVAWCAVRLGVGKLEQEL